MRIRETNTIDQHLKQEYHEICFNPNKREVLLRLTQGVTNNTNQRNASLDNSMLHRYINSIYEHYGIEDPIARQFRLAHSQKQANSSAQKSISLNLTHDSDRLTRTKRRLIDLKASFKRDSNDIVQSNFLYPSNFTPTPRSPARQIGYRTKQKIYFKTAPREDSTNIVSELKGKGNFRLSNSMNPKEPPVFRYCPICQAPILEQNIPLHEANCKGLQQAYQMSYSQIESIILGKIKRLKSELGTGFLQKNDRQVISQFHCLRQSMIGLVEGRNGHSLGKIRQNFDIFVGNAYQQASKLNWFINLHQRILKECERQNNQNQI